MTEINKQLEQIKALLKIAQDEKQPALRRWYASRLAGGIIDNYEDWPDQQIITLSIINVSPIIPLKPLINKELGL